MERKIDNTSKSNPRKKSKKNRDNWTAAEYAELDDKINMGLIYRDLYHDRLGTGSIAEICEIAREILSVYGIDGFTYFCLGLGYFGFAGSGAKRISQLKMRLDQLSVDRQIAKQIDDQYPAVNHSK